MKPRLFSLSLLVATKLAWACSCSPPPPPAEKCQQSTATFVGTVIAKREVNGQRIFDFSIQEVFKGILLTQVSVSSPIEGSMCGVNFTEKERYLIYASGTSGALGTNLCAANRGADTTEGRAEIEILRGLQKTTPNRSPESTATSRVSSP